MITKLINFKESRRTQIGLIVIVDLLSLKRRTSRSGSGTDADA